VTSIGSRPLAPTSSPTPRSRGHLDPASSLPGPSIGPACDRTPTHLARQARCVSARNSSAASGTSPPAISRRREPIRSETMPPRMEPIAAPARIRPANSDAAVRSRPRSSARNVVVNVFGALAAMANSAKDRTRSQTSRPPSPARSSATASADDPEPCPAPVIPARRRTTVYATSPTAATAAASHHAAAQP
jgi:hypothetical protein